MNTVNGSPARLIRLTESLVRRVHRDVPDEGPSANVELFSEADYDDHLADFLAERPEGPVHVFCYGSLIWKPIFEPVASVRVTAPAWSRAFCARINRFRGTHARPGLMMQIDSGDGCEGVVQQVAEDREWQDLSALWRREMSVRPPGNMPRWIDVEGDGRRLRAIAFTANPQSPNYAGRLGQDEVAEILATACGHWGSGAEYLWQTVLALETIGIHDPYLWALQERVADIIERLGPG